MNNNFDIYSKNGTVISKRKLKPPERGWHCCLVIFQELRDTEGGRKAERREEKEGKGRGEGREREGEEPILITSRALHRGGRVFKVVIGLWVDRCLLHLHLNPLNHPLPSHSLPSLPFSFFITHHLLAVFSYFFILYFLFISLSSVLYFFNFSIYTWIFL